MNSPGPSGIPAGSAADLPTPKIRLFWCCWAMKLASVLCLPVTAKTCRPLPMKKMLLRMELPVAPIENVNTTSVKLLGGSRRMTVLLSTRQPVPAQK